MAETTRIESGKLALEAAPEGRTRRVETALTGGVDLLSVRLRPESIRELARRLAAVVPAAFDGEPEGPIASALLVAAVPRAMWLLHGELESDRRALDALLALLARVPDRPSRRRAISEHLDRTIPDARERRRDQAALGRHFDSDVLIERQARRAERHGILIELGFQFLGAAAIPLATAEPAVRERAGLTAAGLSVTLEEALLRGVEHPRWQTATSAIRATASLTRAAVGPRTTVGFPESVLRRVVARADDPEEHVLFVRDALLVVRWMSPDEARAFLTRHARPHDKTAAASHALVRARAIELMWEFASLPGRLALLTSLQEAHDPSELVRMALVEGAASLGAEPLLRVLAVGGTARFEESPRVRAVGLRAVLAGCHQSDVFDPLLLAAFRQDHDALVLEVAADACARAVEAHPDTADLAPRMLWLLRAARARRDVTAGVQEAVSSAVERIDAATDADRKTVTAALAALLARAPRSGVVELHLASLPDSAAARASDPAWMARILGELARDGFGLAAEVTHFGYRIQLGDRLRTRVWRVLHELRHRAPNKRQGFSHSVGRTLRGTLRAHPTHLDEATATTVPGERVTIDEQGGWCRHVPTVDDVLDLPLGAATPVQIASSHGITTLRAPATLSARVRNRVRLTWHYARFAALRLAALRGTEPSERRVYVRALRDELGVEVEFAPHAPSVLGDAVPPHVASALDLGSALAVAAQALAAGLGLLREQAPALLSRAGGNPAGLAAFAGALLGTMLVRSYAARHRIRAARAKIPMTIGGWGTRGKSGTERIKAGLFHGLGFQTLVKTTGCEAMFIQSVPGQRPLEVFIYRPYDKATIWEQARLVELAARLGTEVFLWECMALNPHYVDVLAHQWMRDDLTTITNAFPDHEDIQGPAGYDVAEVIGSFIPRGGLCFTSEVNFLPLFEARAREKGTELVAVPTHAADLLPADLLGLFPYQEHPRNIALVLRMAEHFGVDRYAALALMAEHVVPDLGVLKTYPDVMYRGRKLRFMNGMSANERTGCVSNWRRMGLDALRTETDPAEVIVTVVNNRDDRIARSEVFGRILVEDLGADRHVLIGTNLGGLVGYVEAALDRYLPTIEVLDDGADDTAASPRSRLARTLERLRIPAPSVDGALARLACYARGAGHQLSEPAALTAELERWLAVDARGPTLLPAVLAEVESDAALRRALDGALSPTDEPTDPQHPEIAEPATVAEARAHFVAALARMVVHARLRTALPPGRSGAEVAAFHAELRAAYRALMLDSLFVVQDRQATGDQIIAQLTHAVPPGTRVTVMGIQNIKGTGLDFAYRWVALGQVSAALDELGRDSAARRARAFSELETFNDHGLLDVGLACARLRELEPKFVAQYERDRARALRTRLEQRYLERQAGLLTKRASGVAAVRAVGQMLARGLDHLDSVRRARESHQVLEDLVTQRISIARAALELRALTARQKHG